MTTLAITVIAQDRPGIIARVTDALAGLEMNLTDSSMTVLRGELAMTLICAGPADPDRVRAVMTGTAGEDLVIEVHPVPDEPGQPAGGRLYLLTVHGADRLGIVARLTGVIAEAGGNITDLSTHLAGRLYALTAEVELPSATDATALQAGIDRVAAELGVDAGLHPVEPDDL